MSRFKTQFCPKGHNTFVVGRNKSRQCNECHRNMGRISPDKDSRFKQFCPKNHDTFIIGRDSSGTCIICGRERAAKWGKENPEKANEHSKKWYKIHTIEAKEIRRLNRLKRLYRVPKFGQEGIARFYARCPKGMTVDHIIPLQGRKVSGLHVIWNLQYLTKSQNSRKHNKFIPILNETA